MPRKTKDAALNDEQAKLFQQMKDDGNIVPAGWTFNPHRTPPFIKVGADGADEGPNTPNPDDPNKPNDNGGA